jgi:predicted ribonuclease YlaK
MNHQFLFPDSHILLHYKFFTDIDWCKIVGGDIVELVIPCTVISTLDKKKYDSSDSAVRERARKVTVRLLNHEDGSPIRERVTVSLLDHEPEIDFAQRGLSRESEDDRIIAEILIYREAYPDRQIAVITNDAGMTLKCKRRSIPILEIPEDCRLPDRLDAQAKRIKELQTRVAELESMLPELRLRFSHGED